MAAVTNEPGRQTPSGLAISATTRAERVSLSSSGLMNTLLPSAFSLFARLLMQDARECVRDVVTLGLQLFPAAQDGHHFALVLRIAQPLAQFRRRGGRCKRLPGDPVCMRQDGPGDGHAAGQRTAQRSDPI